MLVWYLVLEMSQAYIVQVDLEMGKMHVENEEACKCIIIPNLINMQC